MSNTSSMETQRDREFILSPLVWPQFFLPVKNLAKDKGGLVLSDGTPYAIGLLDPHKVEKNDFTVYHLSLFGMGEFKTDDGVTLGHIQDHDLADVTRTEYDSIDALLTDGWRVD